MSDANISLCFSSIQFNNLSIPHLITNVNDSLKDHIFVFISCDSFHIPSVLYDSSNLSFKPINSIMDNVKMQQQKNYLSDVHPFASAGNVCTHPS